MLLGVQKHFSIVLCRIYRRTSQNRLPCSCFSIDNYYRFRADNWIVSSFSLERGDASLERRAVFWHSPYKSFAMAVFPANIQAKNFYLQKLRRVLRARTQNYLTCNCHFTSSPSLFPKRATAKGASSSRQLKFKRAKAKGLLIVSCSRLKYVKIGTIWATIWGVNMVSEGRSNVRSYLVRKSRDLFCFPTLAFNRRFALWPASLISFYGWMRHHTRLAQRRELHWWSSTFPPAMLLDKQHKIWPMRRSARRPILYCRRMKAVWPQCL